MALLSKVNGEPFGLLSGNGHREDAISEGGRALVSDCILGQVDNALTISTEKGPPLAVQPLACMLFIRTLLFSMLPFSALDGNAQSPISFIKVHGNVVLWDTGQIGVDAVLGLCLHQVDRKDAALLGGAGSALARGRLGFAICIGMGSVKDKGLAEHLFKFIHEDHLACCFSVWLQLTLVVVVCVSIRSAALLIYKRTTKIWNILDHDSLLLEDSIVYLNMIGHLFDKGVECDFGSDRDNLEWCKVDL